MASKPRFIIRARGNKPQRNKITRRVWQRFAYCSSCFIVGAVLAVRNRIRRRLVKSLRRLEAWPIDHPMTTRAGKTGGSIVGIVYTRHLQPSTIRFPRCFDRKQSANSPRRCSPQPDSEISKLYTSSGVRTSERGLWTGDKETIGRWRSWRMPQTPSHESIHAHARPESPNARWTELVSTIQSGPFRAFLLYCT